MPRVTKVEANPEGLNRSATWLAEASYYNEENVAACAAAGIVPLFAVKCDARPPGWRERFTEPEALLDDALALETMFHPLKTRAGCATYTLRKQTVEPVFGLIKSEMGFRQFLLRSLEKVRNEWTLVCLAWNLKRLGRIAPTVGK